MGYEQTSIVAADIEITDGMLASLLSANGNELLHKLQVIEPPQKDQKLYEETQTVIDELTRQTLDQSSNTATLPSAKATDKGPSIV